MIFISIFEYHCKLSICLSRITHTILLVKYIHTAVHTCIRIRTLNVGFIPSSKRGRSKLIPDEIRESLRKRLIDPTPGKQLNYDEQIELIVSSTYKVWSLGRKKKPWKRPSRRSITRLIKSFKLKRSSTQVQTIARYSSCTLSTPFFKFI